MNRIEKIKIIKYIIFTVAILVLFLIILKSWDIYSSEEGNNFNSINTINKNTNTYSTQANSLGTRSTGSVNEGVAIDLTPRFADGKIYVNIAANTHSIDLGQFDLMEITTLEYKGKIMKPISASKLSGHHSNGEIVFAVDKVPDKFYIIIAGIPNLDERIFKWENV